MERPRVIIVGGGYAGVKALGVLAESDVCDVVLIDRHPYHFLQTDAYELIANECSITQVTIDLIALCGSYGDHVTFIKDTIESVDVANRRLEGEATGHSYDYLLLCAGSKTAFNASVMGLREHAHGVKSLPAALTFKQQFEKRLYERMESEGRWSGEPFTIVIGGGGLSGVEIAAEMASHVRIFYRENTLSCDLIQIFLIIPHESVLEGMDPYLIRKATRRLEKLGVRIINHSRITSVEEHALVLNEKDSLCFDFMIFTGGIVASSLSEGMDLPKNKKAQFLVDPFLRLSGQERIFAAGDIAQLVDNQGNILPPTAQTAVQSGICASENILSLIRGEAMNAADIRIRGFMVALGERYASVFLFGRIRFSGRMGYWIKLAWLRFYRYRLHRQCIGGIAPLRKRVPFCRIGI